MHTPAHTRIRVKQGRPHATMRSGVRAVFAPLADCTNFGYNLVTFLCNLTNPETSSKCTKLAAANCAPCTIVILHN